MLRYSSRRLRLLIHRRDSGNAWVLGVFGKGWAASAAAARRTCSSSAHGGAAQAAAGQAARRAAPEPRGGRTGSIGGPCARGLRVQPLRPVGVAGGDGRTVPCMVACCCYNRTCRRVDLASTAARFCALAAARGGRCRQRSEAAEDGHVGIGRGLVDENIDSLPRVVHRQAALAQWGVVGQARAEGGGSSPAGRQSRRWCWPECSEGWRRPSRQSG